ncbi:MAG: hypothetical protein IJ650_04070 [Paludibacteraceae bacterium]|nr:hypothetical protein [Paludibacteraceae bacterium]
MKQIYSLLKQKALELYSLGQYVSTWDVIDKAVFIIQEFNWEYTDDDLESLLQQLACQWIPDIPQKNNPNDNRVVVIDDWCTSYVLVLQYIEALVEAGKEILYITSNDIETSRHKNIISRLETYPRLKYWVIPSNKQPIDGWCKIVHTTIYNFNPSKIIAHILPCSAFLPVIARLPEGVKIYRSNLDDQVFWLGRTVVNYVMEFRAFGTAVSREKRKLRSEQQLYVPYYPIKDGNPFEGFPELPQDSVIIFSGGDFYKTLDPNYTYWNLVKRILQENSKAILLFATKNGLRTQQDFMERFVKENHLEKQFFFIGFRPDINEVFAHADIFMGTCPICGALTTQLAAFNRTPILQYYLPGSYDDETEQALNFNNRDIQISSQDIESFMAEAKRLINDKEYRKMKADLAYQSTIKPEQFNEVFMEAITTNIAPCPMKYVDYASVAHRWWWPEQMGFDDHMSYLVALIKRYGLLNKMPALWFKYNYRRFFIQKLFSWNWYKNKIHIG